MRLFTTMTAVLFLATLSLQLCAQESRGDRDKRIAELKKQLAKVQQALADEGVAAAPFADPGSDPAAQQFREMKKMIAVQKQQIAELKKKFGADSKEVAAAIAELKAVEDAFSQAQHGPQGPPTAFGGPSFPGVPGFRGAPGFAPGALDPTFAGPEYIKMMQQLSADQDRRADEDPRASAQRGQRLVLEGLELQLGAMASLAQSTEDPEARAKLRAELKDLVAKYVKERRAMQEASLKQLVEQMAELRKEIDQGPSADEMLKQLLGEQPEKKTRDNDDAKKSKKDKPKE